MQFENPLATSFEDPFVIGESDFGFFSNYAGRNESAAILFCRSGHAEVTIDQFRGNLCKNSVVVLLPGAFLSFSRRSSDFRMAYCAFSPDLFAEASFRLDPAFFHRLHEHPISNPPETMLGGIEIWFRMTAHTYEDRENIFRNTLIRDRLQNLLLDTWDKMQRFASHIYPVTQGTLRHTKLFHQFVSLVHENCSRHREVAFYADRLCISTRYLSTIVRDVAHASPKELIDHSVLLEIKMLLQTTDLSVQEIAYRLHFPDQSYLGRFFKKQTGKSPTEYRNEQK